MADKVADLYAKIGFNVNEDGFKKAKKLLQELAQQLSTLNQLSQKHAKENGIFSKKQLNELKHNQTMERLILKEKIQDKRFHQKQQEHLWRMEERAQKRHNGSIIKEATSHIKKLGGILYHGLKITAGWTKGIYNSMFAPSMARSIATRDFMMYTGTPLSALQNIRERFAAVGSSMTGEDIMGELSKVMDNLTKIRFGEGELGGFKLSGIAGFAASRNVSKVLSMIEDQIAGSNIDNQALVHVLDKMGFNGQAWLPYFRASQRVSAAMPRLDDQGLIQLTQAQTAVMQLKLAFERTSEVLASKLSPSIQKAVEELTKFFADKLAKLDVREVGEVIDKIIDDLKYVFDNIDIKAIPSAFAKVMDTFRLIGKIVTVLAEKMGIIKPETKAERILKGKEKTSFQNLYEGLSGKAEKAPEEGDLISDMLFQMKYGVRNYKEYLDRRDILRNFKETGVAAPSKVVYLTDNSSQTNTFNGLENEEFADSLVTASSSAFKKYTVRGVLEEAIGADLFTLQGLGQNMGGTSGY